MFRVRADRGGVRFEGGWEQAIRACLWSRIAVRILMPVAEFDCADGDALYEGTRSFDFSSVLSPERTLAVSSITKDSALGHTMFIAQRTKDAIVDQLRERFGSRPSVDKRDPDVAVFVRVAKDRATVYLDLVAEPLHRRGWRAPGAPAPLKETLAAAIVRLSGWNRKAPFTDPMCGSGTLAIEADGWARSLAPGLSRDRFGFERWADHDAERRALCAESREHARAEELSEGPEIVASDVDAKAVQQTRDNARRARARLRVTQARVEDVRSTTPPGSIVSNPPYGERVETDALLWREIFDAMFGLTPGHRVSLLLPAEARLPVPRHAERIALFNGAIRCELASWDVEERRRRRVVRG